MPHGFGGSRIAFFQRSCVAIRINAVVSPPLGPEAARGSNNQADNLFDVERRRQDDSCRVRFGAQTGPAACIPFMSN